MEIYDKEWFLNEESFTEKFISICQEFDIQDPDNVKFNSQQDEDKYVIQYLLNKKISDGVFLEVGACDGVLYSNTKTLEDYFGFSGILIEPQKAFFKKLIVNRPNCECYNAAISSEDAKYVSFYGNNAGGGILKTLNGPSLKESKLTSYIKSRNLKSLFLNKQFLKVENRKMSEILHNSKFNYVDFMFVDVEGGELELLKSIDFSFPIFCFIIEAHSDEQEKNTLVRNYLLDRGFSFKERQRGNEIWINHNYFRKDLFAF